MTRLDRWIGIGVLVLAAGLPVLALVPLGWVWLWQNGYALHWLAGTLVSSLLAFAAWLWAVRRLRHRIGALDRADGALEKIGSPRENAATAAVEALARSVDPVGLASREALLALGITTIETVARHVHPNVKRPELQFTLPEALALVEETSRRLRPIVSHSIPLGDTLTLAQMAELYRWRGIADVAGRAYDVWRVIRMLNPAAAATQEIRERLSRTMLDGVREEITKRLAAAYVREVGQAAIELYTGRLRLTGAEREEHVTAATLADREESASLAEPLRLLIAGQTSVGKSSLVNALAEEVQAAVDVLPTTRGFQAYEVSRPGLPGFALIDSPGLTGGAAYELLAQEASDSDLVLWVLAANRADRHIDREGLAAVQRAFADRPERRAPAVLVVLTHIDKLRPFDEWQPPYDVAAPSGEKAVNIRAAMAAVADDLGVRLADILPVCLAPGRVSDVDIVWAKLVEVLPEAKGAQLLRVVADARPGFDWRRVMGQAVAAGRLAAGALVGTRGESRDTES
ncbi:MAG: GTPase domain-containing protein [Hyphomicrobiaceae bacterium]|nr:GTPase domain-containing protein [Hyphomicrobiaceae bacterium]